MLARQEEADLSDRPSTRASNDPPEYTAHIRSRSTAHAHSPKRLSVFSGRSRSNTTTSSTSSRRSPASSMTSADAASLPYSHEDRAGSSAGIRPDRPERHESMTKSLFSRGSRILRRQGSKFNIAATLDEEDEVEREKSRFEVSEIFSRHHKTRQSDAHEHLKSLISNPFDFHHLTHTSPSQFQALDKARENDIVTEFSAIRASQRPITGLKGIRADDLHFQGFSSEDLTNGGAATAEHQTSPAPTSPPGSPSATSSISPKQQDHRARRESRVFENFSRPVPRYPRAGSATPPPRAISPQLTASPDLSEPEPRAIDEILGLSSQPTYPEHVYGNTDDVKQCSSLSQFKVEGIYSFHAEHAVTTDTNTERIDARTSSVSLPSLNSVLEEVPEEQGITHWHDSPEANADTAMPPSSSQIDRPAQVPIPSVHRRKSQLSICVAEELSKKFSEALGSPTLPQYRLFQDAGDQVVGGPIRRRSSARRKPAYETIYESWDADIDYCYEHAAESTSNFDWSRNSLDEARPADNDDGPRAACGGAANEGKDARLLQPIHLSTSRFPTPELDPSPARSLPSSQAAVTPSSAEYENEIVSTGGDYFQAVSSSIFPSALGKQMTQDILYEEYLAADAESDRHFSFCSQGLIHAMDHPVSPRSSFSPISKCNSQESLILSRAASIVRKHRSSVSTASVPELVHSLASSRELPSMEHLPSTEQSGYTAPSLAGRTEVSSQHRQTKSLAREIETQIMSRAEKNSSPDSADPLRTTGSVHDRAKSTSEVEAPRTVRTIKSNASAPLPPIPVKSPNRKKGRTSYSLFPTPAAN
ncbi:uncharacterized protein CDV56_108598 [Aspergillus thermomutatus]|uniref:CRIB domain-containing protein n=1 Tax=Aspergillus thermomutatus TaxID=41047 RepID=A0A397HD88_ASPTH|nr:uncharacterized protein CDV56_108598 [Aspergillus thermomutatus]RHZ61075.1 hypothetical protein CDV56_108598 [Aspergillus thermomutatus]